jgi:glycosyltransferase involved in cell wall biosynthesis
VKKGSESLPAQARERLPYRGRTQSTTLVVGPGDRFLSGVSYYTARLASTLAQQNPTAVLLLRRLCPRFAYPGRAHVGRTDGTLSFPDIAVFNGLDWFWGLSALRAWRFWRQIRPQTVILQWWTGTVLHSYLTLAWLAKRCGARLVVEFHEMQDVGEAGLPLVGRYTRAGMHCLLRRTDAVVVHSEFDRALVQTAYPQVVDLPVEVIPHGPYEQYARAAIQRQVAPRALPREGEPVRLLVFGVVRPYKGHAELVEAVRLLLASGLDVHVSVVGEVWQGYREPLDRLAALLPVERLTVVDRYVSDVEVPGFFTDTHVVVLPYHRSSASGPLHIAMSLGLPVVTTSVGGLIEATAGYTGAVLVRPRDPAALVTGIRAALPLVGMFHADPHSWSYTAERFAALLSRIEGTTTSSWNPGGGMGPSLAEEAS